jgi:hypothetical protein
VNSINPFAIVMSSRSVHDKSAVLVVFVSITAPEPPIHRSLVKDADIGLGPPMTFPRPHKWWVLLCGVYHVGFIIWDLLFRIYCLGLFYFVLLLTTSFDCYFGSSCVRVLRASPGYHCPLPFGCVIFECGGVSVSTHSTLTTLVTLVLFSCSRYGMMGQGQYQVHHSRAYCNGNNHMVVIVTSSSTPLSKLSGSWPLPLVWCKPMWYSV